MHSTPRSPSQQSKAVISAGAGQPARPVAPLPWEGLGFAVTENHVLPGAEKQATEALPAFLNAFAPSALFVVGVTALSVSVFNILFSQTQS